MPCAASPVAPAPAFPDGELPAPAPRAAGDPLSAAGQPGRSLALANPSPDPSRKRRRRQSRCRPGSGSPSPWPAAPWWCSPLISGCSAAALSGGAMAFAPLDRGTMDHRGMDIRIEDVSEMAHGESRVFEFPRKGRRPRGSSSVIREEFRAYLNRCSHWLVPLDLGDNDFFHPGIDRIACKTHGATFRLEDGYLRLWPLLRRPPGRPTPWFSRGIRPSSPFPIELFGAARPSGGRLPRSA